MTYLCEVCHAPFRHIESRDAHLEVCTMVFHPVKDWPRYMVNMKGEIYSIYSNRTLNPKYDKDGYRTVAFWKNNSPKFFQVHRLVAIQFIENPRELGFVNHKNGIKHDNRVENLEWCTHKENYIHARNVLKVNMGTPITCEEKRKQILELLKKGLSLYKIAALVGVSKSLVFNAKHKLYSFKENK